MFQVFVEAGFLQGPHQTLNRQRTVDVGATAHGLYRYFAHQFVTPAPFDAFVVARLAILGYVVEVSLFGALVEALARVYEPRDFVEGFGRFV